MFKTTSKIVILLSFFSFIGYAQPINKDNTCEICERVHLITGLINELSEKYWHEFSKETYRVPLIYYTTGNTYMALLNKQTKTHFNPEKVPCKNGIALYKYKKRIDNIPFHMENKMDIANRQSPYFRNPTMHCSDAATAKKLIPEITNTEEWMAIVMHEYFHGFQFSHKYMIDYMADSIKGNADTLIQLYRHNEWFRDDLIRENDWLLKAISSKSKDSVILYTRYFVNNRNSRRNKFKNVMGYDISLKENFWEKTEGTARYMEYYLAYIYKNVETNNAPVCDTLFNRYLTYKSEDFETMPWMKDKTQIMAAYFYVTGFNMCRLLDKLDIVYKDRLFDSDEHLSELIEKAIR